MLKRLEFHRRIQNPEEDEVSFATELTKLGKACGIFDDKLLRDRFLAGLRDQKLAADVIKDQTPSNLTLAKCLSRIGSKIENGINKVNDYCDISHNCRVSILLQMLNFKDVFISSDEKEKQKAWIQVFVMACKNGAMVKNVEMLKTLFETWKEEALEVIKKKEIPATYITLIWDLCNMKSQQKKQPKSEPQAEIPESIEKENNVAVKSEDFEHEETWKIETDDPENLQNEPEVDPLAEVPEDIPEEVPEEVPEVVEIVEESPEDHKISDGIKYIIARHIVNEYSTIIDTVLPKIILTTFTIAKPHLKKGTSVDDFRKIVSDWRTKAFQKLEKAQPLLNFERPFADVFTLHKDIYLSKEAKQKLKENVKTWTWANLFNLARNYNPEFKHLYQLKKVLSELIDDYKDYLDNRFLIKPEEKILLLKERLRLNPEFQSMDQTRIDAALNKILKYSSVPISIKALSQLFRHWHYDAKRKSEKSESEELLSKIFNIGSKDINHECCRCLESFENVQDLQAHNRQNHAKRKSESKVQGAKYGPPPLKGPRYGPPPPKAPKVPKPTQQPTKEFTLYCQDCNLEFDSYSETKNHRREVHGIYTPTWTGESCIYCGAKHRPKIMMRLHVVTQHSARPFPCDHCNDLFFSDSEYEAHCRETHKQEATPLPRDNFCPYCKDTFEMLSQHMLYRHDEVKNFLCHLCDFKHSTKGGLKAHIRSTHPREKDMKMCHLCDYKTSVGHNLKVHIEMRHEKKLNFECSICGLKSYTEKRLNKHIQSTHMGMLNYSCKECGEKFRYDSSLRRHLNQVHSKEEIKFVCQICANTYVQRKSLKRHMVTAHNIIEPTKQRPRKVARDVNMASETEKPE